MLDFPSAPALNQKYPAAPIAGIPTYTWDGEKWSTTGAPISGKTVIYADGSSAMTAQLSLLAQPVAATDAAAKGYVDGIAAGGLQMNGGCDVSQQYGIGFNNTGWLNFSGYPMDGWVSAINQATAGASAFSIAQVAPPGAPAFGAAYPNCLRITATGAAPLAGAGDYALLLHHVEGFRFARLGFGIAAGAQPVTIGFWVYANVAGTACVLLGSNGTQSRCYIREFTVNAPNTWEYKTLTFPPDVSGSANWLRATGRGGTFAFCFGAGATIKGGTKDVWANWASQYATANQTNFYAANGNAVHITGLSILPGNIGPDAAYQPQIMRPYADELLLCKRYWQMIGFGIQVYSAGSGVSYAASVQFPVEMPAPPTINYSVNSTTGVSVISAIIQDAKFMDLQIQTNLTGNAFWFGSVFLGARL